MNLPSVRTVSRPWSLALGVPALAGVIALGGCTGSSGGNTPTAGPSNSASHSSPQPITQSTPPATRTGPNTLVYTGVGDKLAKKIQTIVGRAPGFNGTAYYPDSHRLEVDVKSSATAAQRAIIQQVVNQQLNPPATPSKSKSKGH